jgi:hypothetical protein
MTAHLDLTEALEREYRRAFAEYAAAMEQLRSVEAGSSDPRSRERAIEQVRNAERKYREYRDALAQALLSIPNRDTSVRSVAHAIWQRAGRPSGTAEADWFLAERILQLAK